MRVLRLAARNFRNLAEEELFPCEGVNVIYGENAQGKTNLLEALWLFTGGHSFRGAKDGELPKLQNGENASFCALSMDLYSEGREQSLRLNIENGRRNSVINGVVKKTGSALIGKVCAVIFSPEHLLLVKEGPSRRRSFIDGALCQLKPSFPKLLSVYNRSLLQRNALLKDILRYPELEDTLDVWDARLAKLGGEVMEERQNYLSKLTPKVRSVYKGISQNKETIDLQYSPSVKNLVENFTASQAEAQFLEELFRTRRSDIRSGFTSMGPHRDDMEIVLNGISARIYGSQGQQRSAVLALKLSEAQLLSELTGEAPVILLDDVMSELDQSRQDYLLNHLHGRQVFLTCCSPETVDLMKTGLRFRVENGSVFPEPVEQISEKETTV